MLHGVEARAQRFFRGGMARQIGRAGGRHRARGADVRLQQRPLPTGLCLLLFAAVRAVGEVAPWVMLGAGVFFDQVRNSIPGVPTPATPKVDLEELSGHKKGAKRTPEETFVNLSALIHDLFLTNRP